jgi:pimeloyl-ACP methyl ester carboxylesterase
LMRGYSLGRLAPPARDAVIARLVPESGMALWQTLNWWLDPFRTTQVDAGKINAPILAIAGAKDLVHPPSTVAQTARHLGARYRVMPNMSHWLPGEPGWDEVAAICLEWMAPLTVAA